MFHNNYGKQSADGDGHRHNVAPASRQQIEGSKVDRSRGIGHNDACILKPQKCDKQTDTRGNGHSDSGGQSIKNLFAKSCNGQENEHDTLDKDKHQCVGIGQPEADADGVNEKGVKTHSAGLSQRQVGQ